MANKIDTTVADDTIKSITKEAHSLESDAIIQLYEIDISQIKSNLSLNTSSTIPEDYLRFHNNESIGNKKIYFRGDTYHAMPIQTEGFETSAGGELPRPSLSFAPIKAIQEKESETFSRFSSLKRAILELNNLIGAKVSRIRTYKKFLDSENTTINNVGQFSGTNPEFPREIYYVERKITEDKSHISFELSSVLDLQNFKLPGRLVLATRCPWSYRGEGCCYEFKGTTSAELTKQKNLFGASDHLPDFAPPIANDSDELITGKMNNGSYDHTEIKATDVTEYDNSQSYAAGSVVYIEKNSVKYYYVAKGNPEGGNTPAYASPPNTVYWEADRCSKTIAACKLRWGAAGAAKSCSPGTCNSEAEGRCSVGNCEGAANTFLPFGGFPGTNSKYVSQ
tara:strand:- start:28815 stop:29996 length:1182 start_codon:yes stop_codon:yes gene_type:complete